MASAARRIVLPSSRPLKKGRSGFGHVARAVEGEPRLEQVGGGLHPLPVHAQPEGVWLRAGAEAQRRGATLRVHHGAEFVERQRRRLALGPDRLGRAVRPHERCASDARCGRKSAMAPPASLSAGCGELGSAKPLGPRMSRQMSTSTCVTAPNSPDLDASQDFLRCVVEDVVVVFDEMAADLLGAPDQSLQLLKGRGRWLLHDHVSTGIERVHRQREVRVRRRCDVDHVGPRFLQHDPMVGEPGLDAVSLGGSLRRGRRKIANGGQFHAWQSLAGKRGAAGRSARLRSALPSRADLQDPAIETLERAGGPAPGITLHCQLSRRLADARRQDPARPTDGSPRPRRPLAHPQ